MALTVAATLFKEADEARSLVALLANADAVDKDRDAASKRLCAIFDRYQEKPTLMDPALESIVSPLMARAGELVRSLDDKLRGVETGKGSAGDGGQDLTAGAGGGAARAAGAGAAAAAAAAAVAAAAATTAATTADQFQLARDPELDRIFRVVYTLCKVRKAKVVVKLFPHAVADLEPTLRVLQGQDPSDHGESLVLPLSSLPTLHLPTNLSFFPFPFLSLSLSLSVFLSLSLSPSPTAAKGSWESRYVLLLWLSMIVIVPFDLTSVDSSLGGGRDGAGAEERYVFSSLDLLLSRSLALSLSRSLAFSLSRSLALSLPRSLALSLSRSLALHLGSI